MNLINHLLLLCEGDGGYFISHNIIFVASWHLHTFDICHHKIKEFLTSYSMVNILWQIFL